MRRNMVLPPQKTKASTKNRLVEAISHAGADGRASSPYASYLKSNVPPSGMSRQLLCWSVCSRGSIVSEAPLSMTEQGRERLTGCGPSRGNQSSAGVFFCLTGALSRALRPDFLPIEGRPRPRGGVRYVGCGNIMDVAI